MQEMAAKALVAHGVRSRPTLMLEPGRSIAAPAGLTLYTVGTVKTIPGLRTYVAVDGGMSDNLRPVTYGARYDTFLPGRARAPRSLVATIAGKHCEQGDLLVRDAQLPPMSRSVTFSRRRSPARTAHSMASNYNKVPRPAVVFVRDGAARWSCGGRPDDLVRLDDALIGPIVRPLVPSVRRDPGDPRDMAGLERMRMTELVRVGILGCGNVGSALVRLLDTNADLITRRAGVRIEVARVAVQNLTKERDVRLAGGRSHQRRGSVVVGDPDVDVVVEVIGGIEPARSLILDRAEGGQARRDRQQGAARQRR